MLCVEEVLNGKGKNYILPFLWLHGESHSVLKEEIDSIEACSIREFCIESRPHPDFMGPRWWADLDFIMEEARKRNMRVWVLDDDQFPTGHAKGAYVTRPDKKKIYLAKRHMDLIGPVNHAAVLIENFLGHDGKLLAVFVCKRMDNSTLSLDIEHAIDVTETYKDGMVYFNIPEGFHRLIVMYTTQQNGGRKDYINLIDDASVQVLIDEVYEGHHARYKDDFGTTFAGFFSDEPELGNVLGYGFDELIGKKDRQLPWSILLGKKLEDSWGFERYKNLIGLWYDVGTRTKSIRRTYMDQLTLLVESCFSGKIGAWCKQRNVEYIGHIIEDDNAHTRMGCSIGHYFRAQKGQHMAGIDLVHLQLIPGFKEKYHQWIAGDQDGEFFHFGLAKLGSSSARLDQKKMGRSLCEIFGSYGWAEGVGLMKWLTDHMLVRGVNHFVPHAFSPKYPDTDCPPHFYARGNNPQFPYVIRLMQHMNRMAHLLNGGHMNAGIGVLYHAEAEWTGGAYEPYQKIVRALLEKQLDCTVISVDYLSEEEVHFEKGRYAINNLSYEMLLIPYAEYVSDEVVSFVERATQWNIPVWMTQGHPKSTISGDRLTKQWYESVTITSERSIAEEVKDACSLEIEVLSEQKDLRACSYVQSDGMIYLFFNEHPFEGIETLVRLYAATDICLLRYDSIKNSLERANFKKDILHLKLAPGESACYFVEKKIRNKKELQRSKATDDRELLPIVVSADHGTLKSEWSLLVPIHEYTLNGSWSISVQETGIEQDFRDLMVIRADDALPFINSLDSMTRFSGIIRYESQFDWEKIWAFDDMITSVPPMFNRNELRIYLELEGISDASTVVLNEEVVGEILSAPFRIEITDRFIKDTSGNIPGALKGGTSTNTIKIDVVNTLTWRLHDGQSTHTQINPTGMIQRPKIKFYRL